MATYSFSNRAEKDLISIVDYTLEQWGHEQAEKYIAGLEQQCQLIADNPSIGSDRNSLMPKLMSFPYANHTLFYLQQAENIVILRVLYQQMKLDPQFSQA